MTAPTYTPRADSLPAQVIGFFRLNLDEQLFLGDITAKFGGTLGNIHTQLRPALDARLLARHRDQDGDYIYTAGPALGKPAAGQAALAALTATPGTASRPPVGYCSVPRHVDIDALKVETGVPYLRYGTGSGSKWDPLFDKLTAAGQSVAVPADVKGALTAAAAALKKRDAAAGSKREYRVAMTSPTTARVWRVA